MRWTELAGRIVMTPSGYRGHEITLVGCGGIGARILPALVKMLDRPTDINLWDHDTVELRNLLRQNFTVADVGKPKAEVLAARYANSYARIRPHVARFEDGSGSGDGLHISAVDDWATRKALMGQNYYPVIDCGNDGLRGQVLLGGAIDGISVHTITTFPELVREPTEAEQLAISCELGDSQTVVANQMAATLAQSYIHTLINGLSFAHLGMMFSLPHGVWEIPAAVYGESWRGIAMGQVLKVAAGWTKDQAGQWRPDMEGTGCMVSRHLDEKVDGWTDAMIAIVGRRITSSGAQYRCRCDFCKVLIARAMRTMGLTELPPHLVETWGAIDIEAMAESDPDASAHRTRTDPVYECEQCGDEHRRSVSIGRDTAESERFCSPGCYEAWHEDNPPEPEEDMEPEQNEDEDDTAEEVG